MSRARRRASRILLPWIGALAASSWPRPAAAGPCAPAFVRASISTPTAGQEIARNARFRIGERTGCGEALASARPRYRITGTRGPVAFERVDARRLDDAELVPRAPLPTGALIVEVRNPTAADELGPWETLRSFHVVDRVDDQAPVFAGIERARAEVVEGTHFLSPCHAERGWVVETTLRFPLADDGLTPHDELLYALDRRAGAGAPWEPYRLFRPTPERHGDGRFSWRDEHGFDQTWDYRLRVIDAAGHETTGAGVTVRAPTRPPWTREGSPTARPPAPRPSAGLGAWWRWIAAFGTLFGALIVGYWRRG